MNTTCRFIEPEELHLVRNLLLKNPKVWGRELTEDQIEQYLENLKVGFNAQTLLISMTFENDIPIAMYVSTLFPRFRAWAIGLTTVIPGRTHFGKTAKMLAPMLNMLILHLEKNQYYKFWMIAPENHHNLRNKVMKKYSNRLADYIWFDDALIPAGERSEIEIFYNLLKTTYPEDLIARLFILKQEKRIEYLLEKNHTTYRGTIN